MKGQDEPYAPQAPPPYGDNVPPSHAYAPPAAGYGAPPPGFAVDPSHGQPYAVGPGEKQPWMAPSPAPPAYNQPGFDKPLYPVQLLNAGDVGHTTTIVTQPVQVVHVQSFGPDPIQMPCPHCHATIVTSTRPVSGTLTWLVAGGLCLLGCWAGCCLIPFCVDGCQNVEHQCPNCKALVGTYRRL